MLGMMKRAWADPEGGLGLLAREDTWLKEASAPHAQGVRPVICPGLSLLYIEALCKPDAEGCAVSAVFKCRVRDWQMPNIEL